MKLKKYINFEDASKSAVNLGITSSYSYRKKYKTDPKLPSFPERKYKENWESNGGWDSFLKKENNVYYQNFEDFLQALKNLNISNNADYQKLYKQDPKMHSTLLINFKKEWSEFGGFKGILQSNTYEDIADASKAARALKIRCRKEYDKRYKEDLRLHSCPSRKYKNDWKIFGGWDKFLEREHYKTIEEAALAVKKLDIKNVNEYFEKYILDDKLPTNPNITYKDVWKKNGGWRCILSYKTIEEASSSAIKIGVKSSHSYMYLFKKDIRLPLNPEITYYKDWKKTDGWLEFLNLSVYKTIEESSEAAINLGIKSMLEYKQKYKNDKKLPKNPAFKYKDRWESFGGAKKFLNKSEKYKIVKKFEKLESYKTIEEASEAAINLGIKNTKDYSDKFKKDSKLRSNPVSTYSKEWEKFGGWSSFLNYNTYPTIEMASEAAIKLGITDWMSYSKLYKKDTRLPVYPSKEYSITWEINNRWEGFLKI
jgi:hypothetical protein